MKNDEDLFLAKWLNNDIKKEDKDAFDSSIDGNVYTKIIAVANELDIPEKFNADNLFDKKRKS